MNFLGRFEIFSSLLDRQNTCPTVCFVWPLSRPQLLEKDTVFVLVARERSIYVIFEVYKSLYMDVQAHLGNTLVRYFSFSTHRHTLAVLFMEYQNLAQSITLHLPVYTLSR